MDVVTSPFPLVLVVDDHAESREGCATMLAQAGFRVTTAINGLDGVKPFLPSSLIAEVGRLAADPQRDPAAPA